MISKGHDGFTLLEVLLAGFILFMTISTATSVYSGAALASNKAKNSLVLSAAAHAIRRLASEEFRGVDNDLQRTGNGSYGDVIYEWVAKVSYVGVKLEAPDGSRARQKFTVWEIELSLKRGNSLRMVTFSEVI